MRQQARQRRKRKAKKMQRASEHWMTAHERRQDAAPELRPLTTRLVVDKFRDHTVNTGQREG